VNRAARAEVVPADVRRVFGRSAEAVIPVDPSVRRAQDRGRLVSARSRAMRAVGRAARRVGPAVEAEGVA